MPYFSLAFTLVSDPMLIIARHTLDVAAARNSANSITEKRR
jgi:hypothetical protein